MNVHFNVCCLSVVYMYRYPFVWIHCMCHWSSSHVLLSSSHSLPCLSVHTVVLYSCPELAADCSSCIGLNDNFNCAYCSTASGSCMLSTLSCSPGSLVESPNFDQCPVLIFDEVCTHEHDCVNACIGLVIA